MPKIKGQIIRILDKRTIIINLGEENGITQESIFSILGTPEAIINPETKEELGKVNIVRARVKSLDVQKKFTIATSKWQEVVATYKNYPALVTGSAIQNLLGLETREVGEGNLNISQEDIIPWRAKSEDKIKVGDFVEVEIQEKDLNEPQS